MSKSTKIIAGLGVAAALGVAALPMASFAANYSAEVPVNATVANSIRVEVKDMNAETPAYEAATHADVDGGETAFGTLETVDFGSLNPGAGAQDANQTYIKVTTNFPNGYSLSATTTDLTQTIGEGQATIPDGAYTYAATSNASSAWGINITKSVNGGDASYVLGSSGTYAAGAGTVETVTNINALTAIEYAVSYGIGVGPSQAAGTYAGTATFTVASTANLDSGN